MAGHSKWANIQHRKGRQDAARSKLFSKFSKEITVAAKMGDPDPDKNPRLRLAVKEARANSMPRDNIERAIKKASGGEGESYEEVRYEGYGPNGVAIIVEALTDNRNRTASNIRSTFAKRGGNLGETGSVSFMFDRKGEIVYPASAGSEDEVMLAALDAGAEDVESMPRRPRDLVRRHRPEPTCRRRWRRPSARPSRPSWSGGRRPRPSSSSRRRRPSSG